MLPFNLRFRRLLQTFIPNLTNKDLDKHERLVALRHQLIQERNLFKKDSPDYNLIKDQIEKATKGSNEILEPFKDDFVRIQKLYIDRRRKVQPGKKFQQIPTSPKEIYHVTKLNFSLQWRQFIYFWLYLPGRIKHITIDSTIPQKVYGTAVTAVFAACIYIFHGNMKALQYVEEPVEAQPVAQTEVISKEIYPDSTTGGHIIVVDYQTKFFIPPATQLPTVIAVDSTIQRAPEKESVAEKR